MLHCVAPLDVAAARITARVRAATDPSDADEAVAAMLTAEFEPWPGAVQVPTDGELRDERRDGPTGAAARGRPDDVTAGSHGDVGRRGWLES